MLETGFRALRDYIEKFQEINELRVLNGADWNLEIGAIAEGSCTLPNPPALLFDKIKGYPSGYRIMTNIYNTQRRTALCLDLDPSLTGVDLLSSFRKRINSAKPIPPRYVSSAPILENVLTGDEIDLLRFPVPKWHKFEGGRYIGTMDAVITKEPEQGWINIGTYRSQVHDKSTLGLMMVPGKQGDLIRRRYWEKGKACPVVVVCGVNPTMFCIVPMPIPWGTSELELLGGYLGQPYPVVEGRYTGLPIPADAEIAIEGDLLPPSVESRPEGPFGEFTGYYASGLRNEPVIKVKTIMHRNNPIMTGYFHPSRSQYNGYNLSLSFSAQMWNQLERAGVPGVRGVWMTPAGHRFFTAVSIKQLYPGHAKQAAFALLSGQAGGLMARYIVVVDEEIDPSNTDDVLWAMSTRSDPATTVDIVRDCWSSNLDPIILPEKRAVGDTTNSVAIVKAVRPLHWGDQFPKTSEADPEYRKQIMAKWMEQLR